LDVDDFWRVISLAQAESDGDVERQAGVVMELLVEQSVDTILAFDRILYDQVARAYTRELWAAASIINYGTSDDGFLYFLGWLVAQGREVYEAALEDPDSLADHVETDKDAECESMLYAAQYAYERRTGGEIPVKQRRLPSTDVSVYSEDELPRICPRLWAKFSA
jgi:hypothetical protein